MWLNAACVLWCLINLFFSSLFDALMSFSCDTGAC